MEVSVFFKLVDRKRTNKVSEIIESALSSGRTSLLEFEAELVAKEYGIIVPPSGLAKSEREAVSISRKIGLPLVMKIVSQDILHKSDVGGVKTNIDSTKGVSETYREIIKNAKKMRSAKITGVLVQKMAPVGHEFVVGGTRDSQFGPVVMFGLGGIYVELFKDVAFRIAPISEDDAISMMKETKSYALLSGFRGSKPLDLKAAARTIISVGRLLLDQPAIDSIDINPLFIYPKGIMAVDVRIILGKNLSKYALQRK
jgi:acyl-CoA synthetase (NDP forming)